MAEQGLLSLSLVLGKNLVWRVIRMEWRPLSLLKIEQRTLVSELKLLLPGFLLVLILQIGFQFSVAKLEVSRRLFVLVGFSVSFHITLVLDHVGTW